MDSKFKFNVQEAKRVRVILDTDAACEADDQFTIVHGLLTPKFDVKGIVGTQFSRGEWKGSVERSVKEAKKIRDMVGSSVPVYSGYDGRLQSEDDSPNSDGIEFIISEALTESDMPLYVLCQGAITNVAAALNRCPEIADKFICIWIGGGEYPNGNEFEFNLKNDIHAANVVFKSKLELWQVPSNCYGRMKVSYSTLQEKIMGCSEIGKYLCEQLFKLGETAGWIAGESWVLGDEPVIGLTMDGGCGDYEYKNPPIVDESGLYIDFIKDRKIRVYSNIDSHFILEDLFAKLKINFG